MNIEQEIEADLSNKRRCFPHGTTPLGGVDFVRPVAIKDARVVLQDIDGGHRRYEVSFAEYRELRKHPMRHIGIWEFVAENDPAADTVAFAVRDPQAAGYALYRARQEIERLKQELPK